MRRKTVKIVESEADFGKQVVEILHTLGLETWQEVYLGTGLGNPCIDIVAKLGGIYIALELKLHLNDEVLMQARRNRSYVDYTVAAVPYSTRKGITNVSEVKQHYIQTFGIGVYAINPILLLKHLRTLQDTRGLEAIDILKELLHVKRTRHIWIDGCTCYNPPKRITRRRKRKKKGKLLIETYLVPEQQECIAGSQGGDRTTPFKRSCTLIENLLKERPGLTKKEVWEALGKQLHWKNYNSMCGSFRIWHTKLDCMKSIVFGEAKAKRKVEK